MKPLFVNGTMIIVSTLLTLLALEGVTNLWLTRLADSDTFRKYASLRQLERRNAIAEDPTFRYTQHRHIGFIPTPNYVDIPNAHNNLGCRGDEEIPLEKPEGEFRIVCLGGSTTYTGCVNGWKWSYPERMEAYLHEQGYTNVRVINAGAEAWTSYESLASFELRALDWDPDLVIVYHGINDILARFVWPHEAYKGDNSASRGPNNIGVAMAPVYEHSAIYRLFAVNAGWMLPHGYLGRTIAREQETDVSTEWFLQVEDGTYPTDMFEEVSVRELFETNSPVYFERNLRNLIAIAAHQNIPVVLGTFAYTDTLDQSPWNQHEDFIWTYDQANNVLRGLGNEYDNAHVYEFAAAFPKDAAYWYDVVHVIAEGADLKGAMFGEYLVSEGLVGNESQ